MEGELRPVSILAPAPDDCGLYKSTHTGMPFADCGIRMEYVLAKNGRVVDGEPLVPFLYIVHN